MRLELFKTVLLPNNIKTDHKMKMKNQYKKQLTPSSSSHNQGNPLANSVKTSKIDPPKVVKIKILTEVQIKKVAQVSPR